MLNPPVSGLRESPVSTCAKPRVDARLRLSASTLIQLTCLALFALAATDIAQATASSAPMTAAEKSHMADLVRQQTLQAWEGYKKYAWGHDELKPLSHTGSDWYGHSLLITPVDALDTLLLMKLTPQADEDRQLIDTQLNLDQDIYVRNFEITIRLLGGLLSGYQLTGDKKLLALADDLGHRLLPAFNSPTGMPYDFVNLRTGDVRGPNTNPAMIGSLLLEFGMLSRLTGNPMYYDKAKRALVELYNRSSPVGLVGAGINVETGKWTNTTAGIYGGIDSYYEYLLKAAILFDDNDCLRMWQHSQTAINRYLMNQRPDGLWVGQADSLTGSRTSTNYGALDAFYPAVLVLAGDLPRAKKLEDSNLLMWNMQGIEPDKFDYVSKAILSPKYPLRPEIIESTYYLYHATGDPKYLDMGTVFLHSLVEYCGTGAGFASLKSVVTKQKSDQMGSYLFAETLKYLYLLFAPPSTLNFDSVIFNTEAHPMERRLGLPTKSRHHAAAH
jgi:mannosidase alpha-like ER degradation enhancer 2